MDVDQQVRLSFLDEAEDCCDRIESSLLSIAQSIPDPALLDQALRASHSIKGGAAMMSFPALSRTAHRLEDFFKILRVRFMSQVLDQDVETVLLKGADRLRQIIDCHRRGEPVTETWLEQNVTPLIEQLRQHLGDLETADEDALLAQGEDCNPALLMFEDGVETILDDFEQRVSNQAAADLAMDISATADELLAFGRMANLEPFIQLCTSIQAQAQHLSPTQMPTLAEQALSTWRRSHALVLRGSLDKLPTQLADSTLATSTTGESVFSSDSNPIAPPELLDWDASADFALIDLQADFAQGPDLESSVLEPAGFLETEDQSKRESFPDLDLEPVTDLAPDAWPIEENVPESAVEATVDPFATLSFDPAELAQLQDAFALEENAPEVVAPAEDVAAELEAALPEVTQPPKIEAQPQAVPQVAQQRSKQTVRVSVEELQQFNQLLGKLILERNSVNLRLGQLQNYADLMQRRMQQLSQSNRQLRKWYDRASLEGVIPTVATSGVPVLEPVNSVTIRQNRMDGFDALEMDQYSDLHLISQDQIETVVQLQEVSTDMTMGLQDMSRSISDLNRTTQLLQQNVTRTQMAPFSDVVRRFPRVVRDLSLQLGKSVSLKVEGEATLIDRSVLELVSDALLHLLRNAIDHGIEDGAKRTQAGKPADGTITLRAETRGTQTLITIEDDGGGIDTGKVRDRLRALGMSDQQIQQMTDAELLDFIFEPGFSTSEQVTEVSGRGVGMDLVRTNLQTVRGSVQVDSSLGQGTTFTLQVPYTQSIMRVMLLERAGFIFAVPVDSVREIFRQESSGDQPSHQVWQGQEIPAFYLERYFSYRRPNKPFEMTGTPALNQPTCLITGRQPYLASIVLDRFWGEQEVTVQPISSALTLPPGMVSSLILGDGRVVPLFDPIQLLEWLFEQEPTEESAAQPAAIAETTAGKTVLVVDDSINVRRFLALTLEKAGYQVEQARDGQDAVDKIHAGLSVGAVICDIEMPRLDGYGFLEEVKGQSQYASLPVMMLTSRSNEKHRKLAMNLGASAYFSKPFDESQLLAQLAEWV